LAAEVESSALPPETGRGAVARAAGVIALGSLLSRVLGLVRESTLSHFFGTSGAASAFFLVREIPQKLYDLLVGGHISAALVPVFSEYTDAERRAELWRIASVFCSLAAVALAAVVLLVEVGAPWIITVMAGGWPADLQQEATFLLRLISPALLFMGLTGAVMGLLYALKRFSYPAFVTALFNGGIVVAVLVGQEHLGVASAALGVLLGSVLQLVLQFPGLRGTRLRPTLRFSHPALRRILGLYLPVVFGVAINIVRDVVDRRLASGLGEHSISQMGYATTLIQTALGLIAAAISLAILPSLSRADAAGDEQGYQANLGLGLRLILTLVLPATAVLYFLGRPIVSLFLEHGAFTAGDTTIVTWALYLYLLSLPFAAVDQLLIFAFYARKDTLRPNLVGAYVVGIYLLFALPFVGQWGLFALVIANSAQWIWHTVLMLLLLRRHIGWPQGQRIGATLGRSLLAAVLMGLSAWGTATLLEWALGTAGLGNRLVTVAAGAAVGIAVYLGLAMLLRLEEIWVVWKAVRRKLGRP